MIPILPIEALAQRGADPSMWQRAKARADVMAARIEPHLDELDALTLRAARAVNASAKVAALRAMTDILGRAAEGVVACKKGCGACCHVAVTMSPVEAAVIGKEIGIKPRTPTKHSSLANKNELDMRHYGAPCPFLKENACSIYASRPLACRTQFNMDADALLCTIVQGAPPKVPYYNHRDFTMAIAQAFVESGMHFADLREFFPKNKG